MITDFNNMPIQIDRILQEIQFMKSVLLKRIEKAEEVPKNLNLTDALLYLKTQGIEMSKSACYKRVASKQIPYKKFGNRLVFSTIDLNNWFQTKLKNK